MTTKLVDALTVLDIQTSPVWRFVNDSRLGEFLVRPVERYPVKDLSCSLVGTQVRLSNGTSRWAIIGNVDPLDLVATEHFLHLSIEQNGSWFNLARYHDLDYANRGPDALARFLALPPEQIFPIHFDLTAYVEGDPAVLTGTVRKEPRVRLSRAEIIALAVPKSL